MSATSKRDRQGSRTPADLERKYDLGGMDGRFAEIMGVATDAQTHSAQAEAIAAEAKRVATEISETSNGLSIRVKSMSESLEDVQAELSLKIGVNKNGEVQSAIGATADTIKFKSNKLIVESDNLDIAADGTLNARAGNIGSWHLGDARIFVNASTVEEVNALYSDELYENGITYQIFLTPKGVYAMGRNSDGNAYFANKTWLQLLDSWAT